MRIFFTVKLFINICSVVFEMTFDVFFKYILQKLLLMYYDDTDYS